AAPCRIDVIPCVVLASDFSNGFEIVDRTGSCSSERADDHDGLSTVGDIHFNGVPQCGDIHLMMIVAWDDSEYTVAEASDARGFLNRVVSLRRDVNRAMCGSFASAALQSIRVRARNCGEKGSEIRFAAATRE